MNAISYISGDKHITDFPPTSARPLAAFVQLCNDLLAGPDGYLSPENGILALELGDKRSTPPMLPTTLFTAVAELLSSQAWGVVQYVENASAAAIFDIAKLHRRLASGDMPPIAAGTALTAPLAQSWQRYPVPKCMPCGPHIKLPHF